MFTWIRIYGIVLLGTMWPGNAATGSNITSCEEFERNAYFNPYEVIDSMWKIIYFWAKNTEMYPIVFSLPAKKKLNDFKALVEAVDPSLDIEWHRSTLFMEPRPGVQVLLLYASTPGAFRALVKATRRTKVRPNPLPLIKFADVRFKLVGRYIAMMSCEELTAYVMSRVDDVPTSEQACKDAADTIGYQSPGGRSYLSLENVTGEL